MGLLDRLFARPAAPPRALTASAAQLRLSDSSDVASLKKLRKASAWQNDAWAFREAIGEVRYVGDYLGNCSRRMRLYPAIQLDPAEPPVSLREAADPDRPDVDRYPVPAGLTDAVVGLAEDLLDALGPTPLAMGNSLATLAVNLEFAGEAALIGRLDADTGIEDWSIHSLDELAITDRGYGLRGGPGTSATDIEPLDPETTDVTRIWRPHPRWRALADSPMRGVLGICEDLLMLSRSAQAASQSRLAGSGILYLPDELRWGADQVAIDPQTFMADLAAHMTAPIADPSSAAAIVPIVVTGPAEMGKAIQRITFEREVDKTAIERGNLLIRRLGMGLDVPPEVITGVADVNHWGSWQIDDSTFRHHVEPLVLLEADGLTAGYLRPRLLAAPGVPADLAARIMVWYDPSELVTHPNRSQDAKDGHASLVLSDEALRQAIGFADSDAPDAEELARRLTLNRGAVDASMTSDLLQLLLAIAARPGNRDTADPVAPADAPGPPPPAETPGQPSDGPPPPAAAVVAAGRRSGRRSPGAQLLELDRRLRDRLHAAADSAVRRALEKAGARLRSRAAKDRDSAARIASVRANRAAATLGPSVVASLGLSDGELLADSLADLAEQWDRWVGDTQARARQLAATLAGLDIEDPAAIERLAALAQRQDADRAQGWTALSAALLDLARARLYDPSPEAPPEGEHDPDVSMPVGVIRAALVVAGGIAAYSAGSTARGTPAGLGEVLGQVATGGAVTEFLGEHGVAPVGYRWVYGVSSRPFEPHLALDGVEFGDYLDPALANDGFPGPYLIPGDHDGCSCDALPIYAAAEQEAAA